MCRKAAGLAGVDVVHVRLQPGEELGVQDHAVLDHFRQAGAIFAHGQRGQHARVDQHAPRLPERADHVLGPGQVHAHLAADGAVDLGQERRGHLNQRQAAGIRGGGEAGQIPDHAAADRHDGRLAIGPQLQQLLPQVIGHFHAFGGFAGFDHQQIDHHAGGHQAFGGGLGMWLFNICVGDDHRMRSAAGGPR